jgi:hypothetical protein
MTTTPKPAPQHPKFGTRAGDSLFHDGEGGTLTRRQYDAAVKELEAHKKLEQYKRTHGMPQ